MIVLGFDTATRSTAVALRLGDGSTLQARDDPATGEHPGHATRLLAMADELLGERRASAGARSTGSPLGWGRAPSRACASGSRPRAGWRSRWGWSWSGCRACGRSPSRRCESGCRMAQQPSCLAVLMHAAERRLRLRTEMDRSGHRPRSSCRPAHWPPRIWGASWSRRETVMGDERGRRWQAIGDGAVRFRGRATGRRRAVPPDSSPLHLRERARRSARPRRSARRRSRHVRRSCRTTGAGRMRRSPWSASKRWRSRST